VYLPNMPNTKPSTPATGDQLHIRDAETVARVRGLARASGLSMREVVRLAVTRLDAGALVTPPAAVPDLGALAALDRARLKPGATGLDALYDSKTGLPT
jgi:hypothetical protein